MWLASTGGVATITRSARTIQVSASTSTSVAVCAIRRTGDARRTVSPSRIARRVREPMRAAVDEMGLRLLGVGVVLEVAAATRQDERAQERQLRRVGAEERGHRRAQESLRGRR